MRILSNLSVSGLLGLNSVADANTDTDKFLVLDSSGIVRYRTGAEVFSDIGAGGAAAYTSVLQHTVKAGVALTKGQAVYVSSADGTNMIVSKASNASEITSSKTLGLIAQNLALNDQGFVVTEGLLAGLDTSTALAGDPVWLGTDGNLLYGIANKPHAPNHMVFIGIVTRVQQNNGEIFVKVQNGFELDELHNVQITSTPADNTVLAYENSTSLYKMKSISTLLGYTPVTNARNITINGTTYDLSADRSWSVGTHTGNLTTGYVPKATGITSLTDSLIYDNGSAIGINTSSPYESSAFKLDVNGGLLIKNTSGTAAQLILINSNPATGGNNGFVQLSAGGNTATAFGQWQTYYGMSVASGALRLQPAGGQVLIGTSTASAFLTDINGTLRVSGQLTLGSTISNNTYVYTMPGASGTLALVSDIPSLSGYLTISSAAAIYLTQTSASNTYLTLTNAAATYLSQTSASNTYLTLTNASATYLSQASASNTYLTLTNASATYLSQASASNTYLTLTNASSTYLTQTNASNTYVSLSGSYANPSWITSLAWSKITGAPAFITGITSGMVTTALGYTPYNSSNPAGYITSSSLSAYAPNNASFSDANALTTGGFFTAYNASNVPSGLSSLDMGILNIPLWGGNSGGERYTMQLFANLDTNTNFFIRKFKYFGAVNQSDWYTLIHSGNYSSYRGNQIVSPNGATVVAADSAMPDSGHSFIHTLALGPSGNDGHILGMTWASTTSVYGAQIWLDTDPNNRMAFRSRSGAGVWTGWNEVIHSSNYNGYAPTLTGGGASGTWGISITGSADTVDGYHASGLLKLNEWNGNVYAHTDGRIYGTIFYDTNDTGYYLDPSGSSVLNGTVVIKGNDNQLAIDGTTGALASGLFFRESGTNKYELYHYGGEFRFYNYTTGQQELSINNASGYVTARTSFRAPIFYDSNDTGYYLDLNSTSSSAMRIRGGALFGPNPTWGAYLRVGSDGNTDYSHASVAATNGNLHMDPSTGNHMYLNYYVNGIIYLNGATYSISSNGSYYNGRSEQVTINYNNDGNANYQLLWGSGSSVFGTGGVYVNPSTDTVYASYFSSAYHIDVYTSAGGEYLRITDNQVYRPNGGILYVNWSSNANVALTGPSGGNVGVGNNSPSYKMHVSGDIYANGGWLRVSGTSGLYFETYGGGWHMNDSTWIRSYNGKNVYMAADVRTGGQFQLENGSSYWARHGTYSGSLHRIAYISFDWDSNYNAYANNGIASTDSNGNFSDCMSVNSYNDITLRLDSNDNNDNSYLRISNNTTGSGTIAWIGYESGMNQNYFSGSVGISNNPRTDGYKLNMGGSIHLNGNSVDYVGSLYFNNAGHIQPNGGSYGALQMTSSKNGWGGIRFTDFNTNLMTNATTSGFHHNDYGWQFRWESGNAYVSSGTYGGGSSYTVYHTGNMDAPNKAGTSYYQVNTWLQLNGAHGLYAPSYNGAHWLPNTTSSYTTWRMSGSRGGYGGIHDDYSNVQMVMFDSAGNGGTYREANGLWYWYYHIGNSCMGIGTSTTSSSYKMYVNGTIYATGDVIAYSDKRKKTNIETIENALEKVTSLRGVFYDKIGEEAKGRQLGVIAQEVNEVVPEAVSYANDIDEYGVKYGNLGGLFIEAFKEQQKKIDAQDKVIEELKSIISGITK